MNLHKYKVQTLAATLSLISLPVLGQDPTLESSSLPLESNEPPNNTGSSNTQEQIETMEVIGSRKALYTEITEDSKKLVSMPGALGDPLGAIDTLPGVITPSSGGEPAVRGSSPEDNRYYVDSMPVSYIFHAFNTSIFDENIVQDFQLFSAGFGARYSGATGAIFDIRLRDPKNQDFETTINASLLRAGIFVESGVTENSAFYLSARQGLIQYFLPKEDEAGDNGIRIINPPEDSDYQFKYLADIGSNNTLTISLAGARDYAEAELTDDAGFIQLNPDFAGDATIDAGFDSQSIRWISNFNKGAQFQATLAHSIDKNERRWGDGYFTEIETGINSLQSHYRLPKTGNHHITIGGDLTKNDFEYTINTILFICTDINPDCQQDRNEQVTDSQKIKADDISAYIIDQWQVSNSVNIETGLQLNTNTYTDETFFNPRIAASWEATQDITLSSSAGRYNRFPDIGTVLPATGNPDLASPLSNHFTMGIQQTLDNDWSWSLETYYKTLSQLPLGLDESQPDSNIRYSNDVEGKAYGFDFLINKNMTDRWYGWMSLSYAKSNRTNLRTNETQDYTLDTPVVLNLVGNYEFNDKWNAGFRFSAKSGEATTQIIGIKENPTFPEYYLPIYGEAYQERLPTFIQLDLRAERNITPFGYEGSFYIDILNALNTQNVVRVNLDYDKVNETGELHTEDQVNFGIIPSIGISIKF